MKGTIADVSYGGSVMVQALTELPSSLPYAEYPEGDPIAEIPAENMHRIEVTLKDAAESSLISKEFSLPDMCLQRLTICPFDVGGDQVKPGLLLDGVLVAQSVEPVGKTDDVILVVNIMPIEILTDKGRFDDIQVQVQLVFSLDVFIYPRLQRGGKFRSVSIEILGDFHQDIHVGTHHGNNRARQEFWRE